MRWRPGEYCPHPARRGLSIVVRVHMSDATRSDAPPGSLRTVVADPLAGNPEEEGPRVLRLASAPESFFAPDIQSDEITSPEQSVKPSGDGEQNGLEAPVVRSLALIEAASFLRECIARSLIATFRSAVKQYASSGEFVAAAESQPGQLIILSALSLAPAEMSKDVAFLAQHAGAAPIVVLSYRNDLEGARAAFASGAKGFIPVNTGFELAMEAFRFVVAGGSYLPTECLFAKRARPPVARSTSALADSGITSRQLEVIRAVRQGKSNKIIAHELKMCESTVKVHIRHVMNKLHARNRTDIAIKSADLFDDPPDECV